MPMPKKLCWMHDPPFTGPIPSPSGRGHSSSKAIVSGIAATAEVVRISRSVAERPGSSTQARNDEASTCSITRYVLPAPS